MKKPALPKPFPPTMFVPRAITNLTRGPSGSGLLTGLLAADIKFAAREIAGTPAIGNAGLPMLAALVPMLGAGNTGLLRTEDVLPQAPINGVGDVAGNRACAVALTAVGTPDTGATADALATEPAVTVAGTETAGGGGPAGTVACIACS